MRLGVVSGEEESISINKVEGMELRDEKGMEGKKETTNLLQ